MAKGKGIVHFAYEGWLLEKWWYSLKDGRFDMDGDVEMTMIGAYIAPRKVTWHEELCQEKCRG